MSVAAQIVERPPELMPIQVISKAGTYMANTDSIPWTPFVFPKTFFKLLHLNEDRGSVTLLLLAEKGAPTPIRREGWSVGHLPPRI